MPSGKRDRPPSILGKQEELYLKPRPPRDLIARAAAFEADGRKVDAIEYYRVAGDREALARLRRQAVEDGDLFLLVTTARAMKESPGAEELQALALKARALGKISYAEGAEKLTAAGSPKKA